MSRLSDDDADVARDSLGLIECVHRGDWEGASMILRHGDPQKIAAFTARIADDLVADLAAWRDADQGDMLAALRTAWTEP